MQQLLYPPEQPKIAERRYSAGSALVHPDKQSPIASTSPDPWMPGERDRYRCVCPPGSVDFEVVTASPTEEAFRHSSWSATRGKVHAAMIEAKLPEKRVLRFKNCGSNAWVYQCPKSGETAVESNCCGDRLCGACQRSRSGVIAAALLGAIKGREMRHVVLTLRHSAMPLADQITRIYQCFSNLRRHNAWKRHVVGGAAFCEIKIGKAGDWHVHLHLLVEGDYFPHNVLSSAWLVATGDSDIVWIGSVPQNGKVVGYVSKYVTKAIDQSVINDRGRLVEALLAMRGRRLCLTWGTWRGINLRPVKAAEVGWKLLGRLDGIIARASGGCLWSISVLKALKRKADGDESSETGVQPGGNPSG